MLGTSAAGRNSVYCRCRSSVVIAISPRPCYIGGVSTAIPHIYAIGIEPADIDFMGHVNNANYLKWVQAAVIDHWQRLAPAEAVAGHLWVALKHEITYRKPAFLDDDVIATVLLEKVQGARAFYETIIKRGEDVLAEVKSSWCCLDAETLRPSRLASNVVERFFPKD
ncbi:Acyl-CoA thioester hydrolase [Sphingomonas sp. T1]|jgi:acyl-CoA thioester hydrolase|nr:Acyl-CoA thioester hydrolase [Sphingomonas sp. T1]